MDKVLVEALACAICPSAPSRVEDVANSIADQMWRRDPRPDDGGVTAKFSAKSRRLSEGVLHRLTIDCIDGPRFRAKLAEWVRASIDLGVLEQAASSAQPDFVYTDAGEVGARLPDELLLALYRSEPLSAYGLELMRRLKAADELAVYSQFVLDRRQRRTFVGSLALGTAGLGAAIGAVAGLNELVEFLVLGIGLFGGSATVVALLERVTGRSNERQTAARRRARSWVADYLQAVTGRPWGLEWSELQVGLMQATKRNFQTREELRGGTGSTALARLTQSRHDDLLADVRARLIPDAREANDERLCLALTQLDDALIRAERNPATRGNLAGALYEVLGATNEGIAMEPARPAAPEPDASTTPKQLTLETL
jgi:hypothetical protein